jgi:hypothetical protein
MLLGPFPLVFASGVDTQYFVINVLCARAAACLWFLIFALFSQGFDMASDNLFVGGKKKASS